jgi:RimJ/RimL family protein N-acetyltransferase
MNDTVFIETERLLLRQWKEKDEAAYIQMNRDIAVMEFFPALLSPVQSIEHIRIQSAHIIQNGWGLFAIERKDNRSFIGFTGFATPNFKSFFTPCTEIGWRISKENWYAGFATEAAKACLVFGFTELGLNEVYSFTSIHNKKSERVMKKIGMQKAGEFDHPKVEKGHYLEKHVLYKIQAPVLK